MNIKVNPMKRTLNEKPLGVKVLGQDNSTMKDRVNIKPLPLQNTSIVVFLSNITTIT